jgi:hypothetical protein
MELMPGLLAFAVAVAFWPGIAGAATTPRWAMVGAAAFLLRDRTATIADLWFGLFIAWSALTLLWAGVAQWDGIGALLVLILLFSGFWLGNQLADLRAVYIGAAIGLSVSSLIAVAQAIGWQAVPTITPISGLFVNGNFLAEAAALILVAVVVEKLWWIVPGLLPALALPLARGAILAAAVALMVHYGAKWRIALPIAAVCIAIFGVALIHKSDASLIERIAIWRSALNGLTFFGHGIGSVWSQFPAYDLRPLPHLDSPENLHNEFLNVAFETGVVGLILFCSLCLILAGPLDTARLVLIALFVESCFAFPLHMPATGFFGMVVAGHAMRGRYLLRDLVVRRRLFGDTRLAREIDVRNSVGRATVSVQSPLPGISGPALAKAQQ